MRKGSVLQGQVILVMKLREKCSHCGTIIQSYSHSLNKPLVEALRQLYDKQADTKGLPKPLNLQSELNLTKNQYNNFQKLQYFGLVEHLKTGWVITIKGERFIEGQIAISDKAMTFGGEVVLPPHKAWSNVKINKKYVYEIDSNSWKKIDDYRK